MNEDRRRSRSESPASSSSDSECTEGEITDVNEWLKNTPPKVARTLKRISRSKSFDLYHEKLKIMASPFKETETPALDKAGGETAGEPQIEEDPKTVEDSNTSQKLKPKAAEDEEVKQNEDLNIADVTQTDAGSSKRNNEDSDAETEEETKIENFIEEKIAELPQEDRPEVNLTFDANGRTPTHDDDKLHVVPPNRAHEGQQTNQFYGDPPFPKDTPVWYAWPHSDPGKPAQLGFISCEKPFKVDEVGEDCYTIESTSSWQDDSHRAYYDRCLYPRSRLYYHHEKNRLAVTARGRARVQNPKNWEGLPNVKELPRGTIIVRNGMCYKILSHIEHCSAVFAQLCNQDGTVIGGAADADILHYDTDFKAPTADVKALMLASIAKAEIQKTKTSAILGKILRAETQKRKHRKPFSRETFSSSTRSAMKSEAAHAANLLLPQTQVTEERKEAAFVGRHRPSSVASSQSTNESTRSAQGMAAKLAAVKESENASLVLENEALKKECDELKSAFAEMMSTVTNLQKEKDEQLSEAAELSRGEILQKSFPVEAAMLEHYKRQKETADKEKAALQRQRADLQKALDMQRAYVVEMQAKMREQVENAKSKAKDNPESSELREIARDEDLKGTARQMFQGRSQMTKLEEMLRTATQMCLEAGIEVPRAVLDVVEETENRPPIEPHVPTTVTFADEEEEIQAGGSIDDMEVDPAARQADDDLLEEDPSKVDDKSRSPRTGIAVVLGDGGFYYDKANNAYHSHDVLKMNSGLNIVTHPTADKVVAPETVKEATENQKDNQINSAIESVVVGGSGSAAREEARRQLFPKEDELETYDIEHFRTATPESAAQCILFPSPIDPGKDVNMTSEEFVEQNRFNDRIEKSQKLEAMSEAKHQEKLNHVRRVAEAEIAALEGTRAMEQAKKAANLRSRVPPFAIPNIPDEDVQALRDLDAELAAERSKLREKEKKAEEVKARDRERKAEERRRKKEEKERLQAEAEARRAEEFEAELRRKQQEEHDLQERRRKEKEERRRMREYEASGDRSIAQLQREHEFAMRERKRKADLDHEAELAALKAKYRRLAAEEQKKKSPTTSEASGTSSKGHRGEDNSSDDDLKRKTRKDKKALPQEVDRLLQAKRAELQSLREKSSASAAARATPESTVRHRFRGNKIPESGYVAQDIQPPFEVARKPGKVEVKTSFLNPHEANWRWNWTEFNQIPLKVVQRKSLETNQVNINEFQAMQLAAGFVTMNINRMENFMTKDQAYQELRLAIDAVQAMAEGNMRQVRAAIQNRDLRDTIIQAALMTNVPNGFDYRLVALKQLLHVRNSVINKFHYDAKRQSKAAGNAGGAAGGGGGPSGGLGGAPSTHSSDSGAD